jgi:hypothetical protein
LPKGVVRADSLYFRPCDFSTSTGEEVWSLYPYFYTNPLRRAQVISEYPELTLGDLNWHKRCSSLDITVAFYRMKDCASVPISSSPTARWFKLS